MEFQLDFEYFYHVIKLSYYLPKNTRKGKTMCITPVAETSICIFFPGSLLISLITTIICSLDTAPVSCIDSCYTVQQTLFPSECKCALHIRAAFQSVPLSSESRKFYKQSSVNNWRSSKWKSGEWLIYKAAFSSENPNCINTPAWCWWSHNWQGCCFKRGNKYPWRPYLLG